MTNNHCQHALVLLSTKPWSHRVSLTLQEWTAPFPNTVFISVGLIMGSSSTQSPGRLPSPLRPPGTDPYPSTQRLGSRNYPGLLNLDAAHSECSPIRTRSLRGCEHHCPLPRLWCSHWPSSQGQDVLSHLCPSASPRGRAGSQGFLWLVTHLPTYA